jgi:hypothetical protein
LTVNLRTAVVCGRRASALALTIGRSTPVAGTANNTTNSINTHESAPVTMMRYSALLLGLAARATAQVCEITDSLPHMLFISDNVIMGDIDSAAPFRDECGAATNPGSQDLTSVVDLPGGSPFVMVSDAPDEMEMECFKPGMDWGGNCGECGTFAPMIGMVGSSETWNAPGWFSGPMTVSTAPNTGLAHDCSHVNR